LDFSHAVVHLTRERHEYSSIDPATRKLLRVVSAFDVLKEILSTGVPTLKTLVGDSGHSVSITTTADTLTAETTIDEVKKAIDAGGMS
jgi:hypothetical protein